MTGLGGLLGEAGELRCCPFGMTSMGGERGFCCDRDLKWLFEGDGNCMLSGMGPRHTMSSVSIGALWLWWYVWVGGGRERDSVALAVELFLLIDDSDTRDRDARLD